ncbi:hypothetical protein DPMN_008240 [Dreissena polymorpha]|uniref:Uncharacterized protein n=1 Tax=Dreissena polymorpha TaxID=45954 RepID=A0A9D4RZ26_DREPO|nr:hypothetical protein DPMN_008240 [Dreissena polymorpha]
MQMQLWICHMLQGNNDDLILSCCTHYCKDKARDFMPKDKGQLPIVNQTKVGMALSRKQVSRLLSMRQRSINCS